MAVPDNLPSRIVAAIQAAIGTAPASLHEPKFAGNEWRYVKECLDSTYVSSVGQFVNRFESQLAEVTGAKHAVATVNGTAALHVALQLAGVTAGDEVLVPSLTFIATANAVAYCGATPHFVDSEVSTLGIDAAALRDYLRDIAEVSCDGVCINRRTGRVLRALIPMHTFGHPVDIDHLLALARDFRLALIEDAAESLGSHIHGRHTGTFGLMGVLSFNGNKTVTTGGGGALLTNDSAIARHAKHLTTTAKVAHRWEYFHDEIGYNYRMPNINAALGCAQLEQLPTFLAAKRRLFERYRDAFASVPQASMFHEPQDCTSNYWLQTLLLEEDVANQRDAILLATIEAGYMTRPAWRLLHRLPPYANSPQMPLVIAESLERRLINLPSSVALVEHP